MKASEHEPLEQQIVTTRLVDYPRERVFEAWTNPDQLAKWWGPNGFTNTFEIFEPRPGGVWEFVMHSPQSDDFKNKCVFVEILKPQRIVFDHLSGHLFRVVATFDDRAGKTQITFRMVFETVAERNRIAVFAVDKNEENLDRLEALLAKIQ